MKKLGIMICLLFSMNGFAQVDFMQQRGLSSDADEVVLDDSYWADVSFEEPLFSGAKGERDVATLFDGSSRSEEWQGQLSVVKEVPYSYPWLSHGTMALRVLNAMEAEELEKSQQEN